MTILEYKNTVMKSLKNSKRGNVDEIWAVFSLDFP